jgi:hypothetical protein
MSRTCTICLHPRREEAEELLWQGRSIRCCAAKIGVGSAALHRHWARHVANRDTVGGNETPRTETLDPAERRQPRTMSRAVPSTSRLILTHPAGGQPFCWCARCLGRRGHYLDVDGSDARSP